MSIVRVGFGEFRPNLSGTGNARGEIDGRFGETLDGLMAQQENKDQWSTEKTGELRWSRHATARLRSRGIELDQQSTEELSEAVDLLASKGAKESLVLYDEHAFIVGVQRRTVITAMTRDEAVGSIFTNIDSTIVVR
jgi:flagellar operon protein